MSALIDQATEPAPWPSQPPPPEPGAIGRASVRTIALAASCLAGGWLWRRTFGAGVEGLVVISVVLPGVIGWVGVRARAPRPLVTLISAVVFVVVSARACFGSLTAVSRVVRGLPGAFHQALALSLPVDRSGIPYLVVPATCWLAAAVSVELAGRTRARVGALVPPLALLIAALVYGSPSSASASASVVPFVLTALVFLSVGRPVEPVAHHRDGETPAPGVVGRLLSTRLVVIGIVVALVAIVAGARLPWASNGAPTDLRSSPAFDPRDLPSPLSIVETDLALPSPQPRFKVTLSHPINDPRLVLATLDDYDGIDWYVHSSFRPVGANAPTDPRHGAVRQVSAAISDVGYTGPWIPHVGRPATVRLPSSGAKGHSSGGLQADPGRSSIVTDDGLTKGEKVAASGTVLLDRNHDVTATQELDPEELARYTQPMPAQVSVGASAQSALTPTPDSVTTVAGSPVASDDTPPPECRADALVGTNGVGGLVGSIVGGIRHQSGDVDGIHRAELSAMESYLQTKYSYDASYDHGVSLQDLCQALQIGPYHSDTTRPAARSEQFATAMTVMARSLGIPARLVVGYLMSPGARSKNVSSADARAWMEAYLGPEGWVTFDPSPSGSGNAPDDHPQVSPHQPAPPPDVTTTTAAQTTVTTVVVPTTAPTSPNGGAGPTAAAGWTTTAKTGLGGLGLIIAAALVMAIIIGVKARRRSVRRSAQRPNDRVVGAFLEAVDRARDEGVSVRPELTAAEISLSTSQQLGRPELEPLWAELANLTERALYSRRRVSDQQIDEAWGLTAAIAQQLDRGRNIFSRLFIRARIRSVARRTPW